MARIRRLGTRIRLVDTRKQQFKLFYIRQVYTAPRRQSMCQQYTAKEMQQERLATCAKYRPPHHGSLRSMGRRLVQGFEHAVCVDTFLAMNYTEVVANRHCETSPESVRLHLGTHTSKSWQGQGARQRSCLGQGRMDMLRHVRVKKREKKETGGYFCVYHESPRLSHSRRSSPPLATFRQNRHTDGERKSEALGRKA